MIDINQKREEYVKCFTQKSRIYMIENYMKTYDGMEGMNVPFVLFPRQKEFLTNMTLYQGNITLKPRQTGYSTVCCAKIAAEMVLASPDNPLTILVIAQNFDKAKDNTLLIKNFISQIPRWFFGAEYYSPNPEDPKNKKKIFVQETKTELTLVNGVKLYARSSSPTASNGIAAVGILFCDEAALFQDGASTFMEAIRTTSTIKNKLILMVSTPNGKDSLYYPYYQNALSGSNGYKVTETRWYDDPRYNKFLKWYKEIKKIDEEGEEYLDYEWIEEEVIDKKGNVRWEPERWKQLEGEGWKATSPWYVNACNENNNDKRYIAQSLECSFIGSDSIAVDPEIINMHRSLNVSDKYKTDPLETNTWIWKPPIEGHRYILGIDASRGDAGDNATIEILDIDAIDEDGMHFIDQVLEYAGKMPGDKIGELAYKYGLYYNTAYIVVDAIGGYGEAALLTLLRAGYKNLYYDNTSNKEYFNVDPTLTTFIPDEEGKLPGFHAKGARTFMVDSFIAKLRDNIIRIRSTRVISELETWINKNKKIEHKSGHHDDTLMNLAMALFVYENNFLKLEKQKEMDKAIMKSWINSLTNPPITVIQQVETPTTKYIHPGQYNDSRIYGSNNPSVKNNPYMWVFGKDLNKKQPYRNPYVSYGSYFR